MNALRHAVLLFLLLSGTVHADSECFCLVDDADNIRYGCFTQKKGYKEETYCLDQNGEEFTVTDLKTWHRIDHGTGRCDPCKPVKPGEGSIRGGDDTQQPVQDTTHERTR